ncbi:hypothetical protein niasHT_015113 [Heterodera trifolii]|uniref:Serpin domain-containing protein n=1 Tax=Heterodera trifolii TaxID=157864 RepID=A0ABD2L9K7_9BILA
MPPSDLNASIAKVQNDFALKLLREFAAFYGNASACISPPAVAVTLALTLSGAKDKTSDQLSQVLAKGTPKYRILPHYGALLNLLHGGGKKFAKFTVESVCKLCLKSDIALSDAFKASLDKYFGAHLELVDFGENMKQLLATTAKVNKIVLDASHGAVKEILKPELFNAQTNLLLLSAFYFKGKWAEKFDPDLTQKRAFFVGPTDQKEVYMMQKTHFFDYYDDNSVQLLAMHCDEASMYLALPKERFGLANFLANLTVDSLFEMAQKCRKVKLNVAVPKIKLDQTVELNEPLKKLGLVNVFENANFQAFAADVPSLSVSKVLQKAVLEIDEQGGHDDAMSEAGLISPTSPPLKFVADHPFAIFVVSQTQQTIVLTGIYQG